MPAGFVTKALKDPATGNNYNIKFFDDGTGNLIAVAPYGAATDARLEAVRLLLSGTLDVADSAASTKLDAVIAAVNTHLATAVGNITDNPWIGSGDGSLISILKSIALASGANPTLSTPAGYLDLSNSDNSGYVVVLGL